MASNKCPDCKRHFQTLDDEVGMHDCPNCGWPPGEERDFIEEDPLDDDWLWEKEAEIAEVMNEERRKENADEGDW